MFARRLFQNKKITEHIYARFNRKGNILWKKKNPQFAKMYSEMALNEITHAGHVKDIGESEIMSLDWVPDDDKAKWQGLTVKIGKDTAWVKMLLNA